MIKYLIAFARRLQTRLLVLCFRKSIRVGDDVHIGARSRFWAPDSISIGNDVYIGKDVHIECNAAIGNHVLCANRVALLGRNDHDFHAVGVPVRFSPWIGAAPKDSALFNEKVTIEDDVWLGYAAIVLSSVTVGRGAIVAAGSVVTKDVAPYTIVAGNPAREVGKRFADEETITRHERGIATGRFIFSERGYEHWIVEPGK